MEHKRVSSGAPWEQTVGYSRGVRTGNHIEISGTVAVENGKSVAVGDAYGQTKIILNKVKLALIELGADLTNVVRTRIYVTDIGQWKEIGRAHGEYFKDIRPATSMIQVAALIHADYLVEIEATAIVSD